MNSSSLIKSSNGITSVSVEARLLAERKLFLEGDITAELACSVVRGIMLLALEDRNKAIDILINSPGGEINAGLCLYDTLQTYSVPIRLFCVGRAFSMAAVLFSSGKHGRYMLPNSELVLHEPMLTNYSGGSSSSSIKSISDSLLAVKERVNRILAKHTGNTVKRIEEATGYDHYFNPEESIQFGLCDGIVGFDDIMGGIR